MKKEIDDFLLELVASKGLSNNTIYAYENDLKIFSSFIKDISLISQESIIDFIGYYSNKYAEASVLRMVVVIRLFIKFISKNCLIKNNISIDIPKIAKLLPDILSYEDILSMLGVIKDSVIGLRDRAIIELMYGSGLRVSEVCDALVEGFSGDSLKVCGKGLKERVVPINDKCSYAINNYLEKRDFISIYIFVTKSGKKISRVDLWKMIKKYVKNAGILKNIYPHSLRHAFATHLLDNGADIRVIQDLLGHSNIATTERYVHISKNSLKDAFLKFHPRP